MDHYELHLILDSMLDKLEEGIHVVDQKGLTLFYNVKMANFDCLDKKNVINVNIQDIKQFISKDKNHLLQTLQSGIPMLNMEQIFVRSNQRRLYTISSIFPIVKNEIVLGAIKITREKESLVQIHSSDLTKSPHHSMVTFKNIVGKNKELMNAINMAKKAAQTRSSVLIVGETGSGKEIFSQGIHNSSPRFSEAFIAENCAALPESLIEGILFGTTRGAFTGAIDRPGLFEVAHRGTLMLDELNALPLFLQAKLLRVIQEKSFRRIGDVHLKQVDVRFIGTINEPPAIAMRMGRLRPDLFYRLAVVIIYIPPLRERMEDIPLLIDHFIQKFNLILGLNVLGVSASVLEYMLSYKWPGNVRELESIIEGAFSIMDEKEQIIDIHHITYHIQLMNLSHPIEKDESTLSSIPLETESAPISEDIEHLIKNALTRSQSLSLKEIEHMAILHVMHECKGNITSASKILGISRQNLQYKIKNLQYNSGLRREAKQLPLD
ncbi:MAG: sigma 54-interacting transcriptional regulator [Acidibacillus sp.]|nr:sigma 54-interacting transcriptional regulator [Acidibacillus sp.]